MKVPDDCVGDVVRGVDGRGQGHGQAEGHEQRVRCHHELQRAKQDDFSLISPLSYIHHLELMRRSKVKSGV